MNPARRSLILASLMTACEFALPRRAQATTLIPLDLEQLIDGSGLVILGRALNSESSWETYAGGRRIVTRTRVAHEDVWHSAGEKDSSLESTVITLGGVVNGIGQKVPGEAALQKGEASLLFLTRTGRFGRAVVGMAQGHYRLHGEGDDARLLGSPGLHYVGPHSARFGVRLLHGQNVARARQLVQEVAK